jgi:hypothetical protein
MQYKVLATNLMWSSKDIGLAIQLRKSNNQGLIKLPSGIPMTNNQSWVLAWQIVHVLYNINEKYP